MRVVLCHYIKTLWTRVCDDFARIKRAGVVHFAASQWINQFVYVAQRVLLARILGVTGIGHIAVVSSALHLIRLPAGGGVFAALTKLMAESSRDVARERSVMGTALYINLATALITSVAAWFILRYTQWIPDVVANRILRVMVPFLPVMILSESFRCALIGQRRIQTVGLAVTISAVFGLAVVIVGAWKWGMSGWTVAQIGSFFIVFGCVAVPLRKVLSIQWDGPVARRLLGIGLFSFLGHLMGRLILQFDTLAVSGLLKDAAATGVYNTAALMAQQLMIIPGAVLTVTFPVVAQNRNDPGKLRSHYLELTRKLIVLNIGVSLVAGLAAYPFFMLMGSEFIPALRPFWVLLLGFFARSLFVLDNTYLDALGRTDLTFVSGVVATIVTVVLNLWMIPRWGILGAAWATTIAMSVSLIIRRVTTFLFIFRWNAVR